MRRAVLSGLVLALCGCVDDGDEAAPASGDAGPLAPLDGGPCPGVDAHITPPCTEGRTCRAGPFCWGGRERYCPPGFEMVAEGECRDGLYVGDGVSPLPPDPRCPAAAGAACPDLLGLTCVYVCGEGYRAQTCDGERFVDDWLSVGCEGR